MDTDASDAKGVARLSHKAFTRLWRLASWLGVLHLAGAATLSQTGLRMLKTKDSRTCVGAQISSSHRAGCRPGVCVSREGALDAV